MTHAATLPACLDEAFRRLAAGVKDRRCAFHTPTLATTGLDGAPEIRTVVLRGFDGTQRVVLLHTDARSRKVASLLREPRCAVHLYDAVAALQLRLTGRCTVHSNDGIAEGAWRASRPASRKCYATERTPGSPVPEPPQAPTDPEMGRAHFRVLCIRFDRLEWLHLSAGGHRRALFTWRDDAALQCTWLVP
jgi:hypothetical protein